MPDEEKVSKELFDYAVKDISKRLDALATSTTENVKELYNKISDTSSGIFRDIKELSTLFNKFSSSIRAEVDYINKEIREMSKIYKNEDFIQNLINKTIEKKQRSTFEWIALILSILTPLYLIIREIIKFVGTE